MKALKVVAYYVVGIVLWFLLFGRDDDGKKKLEKGGSNA